MNYRLIFKTAMLAGQIMAQSGAETFRVEDTMIRILKISNLQQTEVFATATGIMATLSDPDVESISEVRRISRRDNNLGRINEVNQISRDICDGAVSLEVAYDRLLQIRNSRTYSKFVIAAATVISTGGFAGLFGGSVIDCIVAAVNGLLLVLAGRLLENRIDNFFMTDVVKSFLIAFFTLLYSVFLKNANTDLIIIGSIMPLVPGIPITNAIRDTLQGDYMSGTARAVEAFIISFGITVGIGLGMGLFNLLERVIIK